MQRCVLNSKTHSPSDNLFYDLLVQDSAMLTVCFHYSVLRKHIIFVFDPEIWIAKTDGHN